MSETHEQALVRRQGEYEAHAALFSGLPGAASLVAAYDGWAPSFHDAELLDLQLSAAVDKSRLRISNPYPTIFDRGRLIVTLTLGEVVDVDLQHFLRTNILSRLRVLPATQRPERAGHHRKLLETDLELELESSVGASRFIICSGVAVSWRKDRRARQGDI
ncbi:MAG: hypothetical protein P4M09_05765 [Devosia sp.]|nr:hypothetical protein [Devosia sp.]